MNFLKKVFLALLIVTGVLLIGSLFLPSEYEVTRDIAIDGTPEEIFAQVQDLKTWKVWSPWNPDTYPGMEITYSGAEKGVGAKSAWTDPKNGNGSMEITVAENFWEPKNTRPQRRRRRPGGEGEDEKNEEEEESKPEKPEKYKNIDAIIEYDFNMEGFNSSIGTVTIREVDKVGRSRVTMTMKGNLGSNPVYKYFGLMMDSMMGSEFDQALMGLRDMTQKRGRFAPPEEPEDDSDSDEAADESEGDEDA